MIPFRRWKSPLSLFTAAPTELKESDGVIEGFLCIEVSVTDWTFTSRENVPLERRLL